jgi:hypothetical protein
VSNVACWPQAQEESADPDFVAKLQQLLLDEQDAHVSFASTDSIVAAHANELCCHPL